MPQAENPISNLVQGLQSERGLTKILHKIAFPKSQLFITIMKYLRQVPNEEKSFILRVQMYHACVISGKGVLRSINHSK